jgi:hypothetical protein
MSDEAQEARVVAVLNTFHRERPWQTTHALAVEVVRLMDDAARLDWLQAHSQAFPSAIEMDHDARLGDDKDLRAAIDAGRRV